MPLFEFHCSDCHRDFEELIRSPNDDSAVRCPECGGGDISRKFSVFSARSSGPGGRAGPDALPIGACGRCGDPRGPCGT